MELDYYLFGVYGGRVIDSGKVKHELRVTNYELRVQIHELPVHIQELEH